MASLEAQQFHAMHERGGFPTHADCLVCFEAGLGRLATVADIRAIAEEMVRILTQAFDDGLSSVRDALTEDETAQQAADARVTALLQELADAAKSPAPADPGAVDDIVKRIKALTARDVADSTAGETPAPVPTPSGTESAA